MASRSECLDRDCAAEKSNTKTCFMKPDHIPSMRTFTCLCREGAKTMPWSNLFSPVVSWPASRCCSTAVSDPQTSLGMTASRGSSLVTVSHPSSSVKVVSHDFSSESGDGKRCSGCTSGSSNESGYET